MIIYSLVVDGEIKRANISLPAVIEVNGACISVPAGASNVSEFGLLPQNTIIPEYNKNTQRIGGCRYVVNSDSVDIVYDVEDIDPTEVYEQRLQAINDEIQVKIRSKYSLEDEQYFARIGVGKALGVYEFQEGEQEALLEFGAYVELIRQWGPLLRGVFFASEWGEIEDGVMTIYAGYAWDGCSPSYKVMGLWFGVPDGANNQQGLPKAYHASLVHDFLCQYSSDILIDKLSTVKLFRQMLIEGGFSSFMADVYATGVCLFGPQKWGINRKER